MNGKVRNSGNNADKFGTLKSSSEVPSRYADDPRFPSLAKDPAKGSTTPGSIQEAMAGLEAESQGLIKGPIKRDPSGGLEFIDNDGKYWDVKAPTGKYFNVNQSGPSIRTQLLNVPDVKVLLDTSYIDNNQLSEMRSWLINNLSPADLSRVVEVNSNLIP